jgi:phage shock protein PspC (stress-responsive transcriptional regulator)
MAPDESTTDWYPPPPPPPPAAPPARRLERSRRDRKIAGVCGGLGDYFDIDPVIFRIGFVVLTIAGGSGVLLYIAGMIFIPEEGRRRSVGESLPRHGRPMFPMILLGIGFLMLWGQMFNRRGGGFGFGFTLLAIGAFLLWRRSQRHGDWRGDWHEDDLPPAPGDMYPPRWDPPATPDVPWTAPGVQPWTPADDGIRDETGAYTTTFDAARREAAAELPPEPEIWPPLAIPPAPPRAPSMTPVLLSFLFVVAGIAALLSTTNTIDITAGEFLAGALIATGFALVVNAVRGGRSRGLIALGILLTIALSAASVLREPFERGIGQRNWAPTTLSQLERPYRLGIGEMDLDLTRLRVPPGRHTVAANVGIGRLKVMVPEGLAVEAKGDVGVGGVQILDRSRSNGSSLTVHDPEGVSSDVPQLVLHLHTDLGQVEVDRVPGT